jgi:hypothetical protein
MPKITVYIPEEELDSYLVLMNDPGDYEGPRIHYSLTPSTREVSLILTLDELEILKNH